MAGLAGWALLAILERATRRAATWTWVAVAALVLSLAGPAGAGATAGGTVALVSMHLAAGAVLMAGLRRGQESMRSVRSSISG